mgnify:FL=1
MRKLWWLTAPVAAGLMMTASSQPYFTLVKPNSWSNEILAAPGETASFDFPVGFEDARRAASVRVLKFEKLDPDNQLSFTAVDGFDVWVVLTQWEAPPDSVLVRCVVWAIGSDGRKYDSVKTVWDGERDNYRALGMDDDCVPPDQAGPKVRGVEFMSEEEMIDPGSPRPEKWKKLNAIVVPHGVQPREMTIYWAAPDAVTLELPEPEDFVDKLISRGSPAPPGA